MLLSIVLLIATVATFSTQSFMSAAQLAAPIALFFFKLILICFKCDVQMSRLQVKYLQNFKFCKY